MRKAVLIGASGLVGSKLVEQILAHPAYDELTVFVRRRVDISSPKLRQHRIDFDDLKSWEQLVQGDVLFSTLGTTIRKAGSKPAQYRVDYTYQYEFARAAARNGVSNYVLVSSAGANPGSKIFYSRMKGELERDISPLGFHSTSILQPSLLWGSRQEERVGEKLGYHILKGLNAVGLFRKYRPIDDKIVAAAMLNADLRADPGLKRYVLDEIFELAARKS